MSYIKKALSTVNLAVVFTALLVIMSLLIPLYFRDEFFGLGAYFINKYGQDKLDITILIIAAISSTPLALPVWCYAVFGAAMGFSPVRLILVVSMGAALGSSFTYFLGRFFGNTKIVRKKFPNLERHPWTSGRSALIVSILTFLGTASPFPIDVVYAACGLKKYPFFLFWPIAFVARVVKYTYLVYGFKYIQGLDSISNVF